LLHPSLKMANLTELLLYQAARAEHCANVIIPSLKKGRIVLCDRFTDATIAYQGFARGISLSTIDKINQIAAHSIKPNLTLLLDHPPKIALQKAKKRKKNKKGDRLEKEGVKFQKLVQKGYKYILKKEPKRMKYVPIQPTIAETQAIIRAFVVKKLFI